MNRFFSIFSFMLLSVSPLVITSCNIINAPEADGAYSSRVSVQRVETPVKVVPVQQTKSVEASAETVAEGNSAKILETEQIKVTKTLNKDASVGSEVRYKIDIQALEDIGAVRLTELIPEGIELNYSTPDAKRSGNTILWTFPPIDKGQTHSVEIAVTPVTQGNHRITTTVSVENRLVLDLFSGQPELTIQKEGPSHVELGETATWRVTVANKGSANARNIIITDRLPDAFEPVTQTRHSLETLAIGAEKSFEYSAKAVTRGEFENNAIATYEGGPVKSIESKLPVKVVRSSLRVRNVGPEEAYVFKPETFKITIENTGDTDLKNVHITNILPEGSAVADNGFGRVNQNAIGWMIPFLPAGSSQLITTEIAATRKGKSTNTVRIVTQGGVQASDSTVTNWLAVPGVTVSISDSKDPIRVKERTTYNIQVNNQGKFEPVSGTVTVTFNQSIKPITVTGDTQGTIDGQTVTFPRTTLEPGKDIYLSVIAEGAKIGPGRIVMNFSADFLSEPILSQETTNVY